jgi:hypothetical protein
MSDRINAQHALPDAMLPKYTQRLEMNMDDDFPQFDYRALGVPRIGDTGVAQGLGDDKPIEFPAGDVYGINHGEQTAKLAIAILAREFPDANNYANRSALWTAALFHDVGRQEYFGVSDPYHGERGARLVERIVRHSKYWADETMRERAARLVAHHSKPPSGPGDDPLAICLWDADCYEAARYRPGTSDGLAAFKAARGRVVSGWARNAENAKVWMRHRGWRS